MGWTGTCVERCPKGKERIVEAIRQEGLNYEEAGRKSVVIDSAMVGSTVYCAVHFTDENNGRDEVWGCVILTAYNRKCGEFLTKAVSETMGPCEVNCPKRIIDKLSPANREWALEWREKCKAKKEADKLAKVAFGGAIHLTGEGYKGKTLYAYKHKKTKVFVDWISNTYYTQKQVRSIGYEVA